MKMSRFAALSGLLCLAAGVSATDCAMAGEVYKCVEGGSTVYQDLPCANNPDQPPRQRYASSFEGADTTVAPVANPANAPPLEDPNKKQRADLFVSMQQAEQERARVEQAYKAEVAAAQQKYKDNQVAAAAEVKAINQRWSTQSQDVFNRQKNLADQAQQLCPGSKEITKDGMCR